MDNSERTRGHSKKLIKESVGLDIRKFFFSPRVVNKWNRLSKEVVSTGTVDTFKKRLEEMLNAAEPNRRDMKMISIFHKLNFSIMLVAIDQNCGDLQTITSHMCLYI